MTISVSDVLAVAAILLGILNFVMARISARQNLKRRMRDDKIKLSQLLDEAFDLLYAPEGYAWTKNSTKLSEAEKNIEQALRIDPNDPRAVEYDGHLFEVKGNKNLALSRYRQSIALDPKRARPHGLIGLLLEGDEAKKSFERAISLEPDKAALYHYNLALVLLRQKHFDAAESHLELAIEQSPQYADAHDLLGDVLKAKGKPSEARRHYEQAIDADPNHIVAMVDLGLLLCESPETDKEGMDWLESARSVNPRNTYPLRMMAAIYADRNQHQKALEYAEKVISIDPREKLKGKTTRDLLEEMQSALQVKSAAAESSSADRNPVAEAGVAKLPGNK